MILPHIIPNVIGTSKANPCGLGINLLILVNFLSLSKQ